VGKIEKKVTWMTRKVQIMTHLPIKIKNKDKNPSMGTTLYFL
jgi:hypothetical protein